MKVTNTECAKYVSDRVVFRGNNLFSEKINNCYVVFSYGCHFPIYVYKGNEWYENKDSYSVTTSKHKTQARPVFTTKKMTTKELKQEIGI